MHLIVHELKSLSLKQKFTTPDRFVDVVHVRPHLYKHLSPSGNFKMQIQNDEGGKISESNTLTAANISSSSYFHGYIRFDIKAHLRPNTEYYFALIGSSYTFSESAYIGWCNAFDFGRYINTASQSYPHAEMDMEIWENMPGNLIEKRVP